MYEYHACFFLTFAGIGLFTFGGAYGAIPLIRNVVLSYGWIEDETLTYMIAVSESTPGPVMVDLATGILMILQHSVGRVLVHYHSIQRQLL